MPILRAPNGRTYRTEDETEIRELTLGHGYTVVGEHHPNARPTQNSSPHAGRASTDEHDEDD